MRRLRAWAHVFVGERPGKGVNGGGGESVTASCQRVRESRGAQCMGGAACSQGIDVTDCVRLCKELLCLGLGEWRSSERRGE
jgi:hypothetical protein